MVQASYPYQGAWVTICSHHRSPNRLSPTLLVEVFLLYLPLDGIQIFRRNAELPHWNLCIYNRDSTEWSPVRSVIIRVICWSRVWLQTELDNTMSCYQLIIITAISNKSKNFIWRAFTCNSQNLKQSLETNLHNFTKSVSWIGYYSDCNQWEDLRWLAHVAVRLQPTVRLHFTWLQLYLMN